MINFLLNWLTRGQSIVYVPTGRGEYNVEYKGVISRFNVRIVQNKMGKDTYQGSMDGNWIFDVKSKGLFYHQFEAYIECMHGLNGMKHVAKQEKISFWEHSRRQKQIKN